MLAGFTLAPGWGSVMVTAKEAAELEKRRLCAVNWLRHRALGVGSPYHEPSGERFVVTGERFVVGRDFTHRADVALDVCKHCGCLYRQPPLSESLGTMQD